MNKAFTLAALSAIALSTATVVTLNQTQVSAAKKSVTKTAKKATSKKQPTKKVVKITTEKQAVSYLSKSLHKSGFDKGQLIYVPLEHTKKGFQIRIVDRNIQKNGGSGTLGIATVSSNGKITY